MLRPLALASILSVLLCGTTIADARRGHDSSRRPGRPNIVLILTDDLDVASFQFLPKVKELIADAGVTFENYFVTASLCCPSRASILTGQYPHNHGVLTNAAPLGGFEKFVSMQKESETVAVWLKSAGYTTFFAGKYLNGYPGGDAEYVPPGWDQWFGMMGHYFGYEANDNGKVVSYGREPGDYETDVLASKAAAFIRRAEGDDARPFLIYLAPHAPHAPATPAPRHAGAFLDLEAPRAPSFDEPDVSDKPSWLRTRSTASPELTETMDKLYRKRAATLLAVDEMVEKIVRTLEACGEMEDTYLFFTSDNGLHLGQHRLGPGKGTAYDEDIRVPLVVRGPRLAHRSIPQIALNIDLAPTFAQIARVIVPGSVDGRSLLPLMRSKPFAASGWRKDFLVEHWLDERPEEGDEIGHSVPSYRALRTTENLYVEYEDGERELYVLRSDPMEMNSLPAQTSTALVRALAGRLAALRACAGASCRR